MTPLDAEGWKDKSLELANDIAKQFIALALAGIAFAVGITGQDGEALRHYLFWVVIGAFGVSAILGFIFTMMSIAYTADGKRLEVYAGVPRLISLLQIVSLTAATVALLAFHVDAVARRTDTQDTRLTIQQAGKDTTLLVQPGKSITIALSPSGELRADVK